MNRKETIEKLIKDKKDFIYLEEIVKKYYPENLHKKQIEKYHNYYLDKYLKYKYAIRDKKSRKELSLKRTIYYFYMETKKYYGE